MKSIGITALGIAALLSAPVWGQTTAPTRPSVSPSGQPTSPSKPASPTTPAGTRPSDNANPPGTTPGTGSSMRANPMPFGQLDANHDGGISQDELRADTTLEGVKFSDLDANKDGKVSAQELTAWQRKEKASSTPPKP